MMKLELAPSLTTGQLSNLPANPFLKLAPVLHAFHAISVERRKSFII
jgi:hypothetical protein